MSDRSLRIQMYGLNEFDKEIRSEFKLPGDPYSDNDEIADKVLDYFKSLGVVFYRDERYSEGIIIEPDDGIEESMTERSGWTSYKNSCIIDRNTGRVALWPQPSKRKRAGTIKYEKHIKKHGDARAWLIFNQIGIVQKMTEYLVSTI